MSRPSSSRDTLSVTSAVYSLSTPVRARALSALLVSLSALIVSYKVFVTSAVYSLSTPVRARACPVVSTLVRDVISALLVPYQVPY